MNFRPAISILVLLTLASRASAEPVDVGALKEALASLTGEALQRQHGWSNTAEGDARWSDVESTIERAKAAVARVENLASDIESAESAVESRKRNMESKGAEIEHVQRVRDQYTAEFDRRYKELTREFEELAARKGSVPDDNQAAIDAWNAQLDYLERKQKIYNADLDHANQEVAAMATLAIDAWTNSQQEYQDAEVKHTRLIEEQNAALADFEAAQQAALATMAAPAPRASSGFSPGFGFSRRPGTATRDPLRELRVVARKSQQAATAPADDGSRDTSGLKFDTPTDDDAAVPLEFEDGAVAVEAGGAATDRPVATPLATSGPSERQKENIARLDELYQLRNKIVSNPSAYAPDALTHVINDITSTHSAIVTTAYETKVAAEGSKKRSLIVHHDDDEPTPASGPPSGQPDTSPP